MVTVTVYVPAFKLDILADVAPVLHAYVGMVAFVVTEADPLGLLQLELVTGVQTAVGGVLVLVITA